MTSDADNAAAIDSWARIPVEVLESFDPEGDFGRQNLINPAIFEMLGDIRGCRVLDAGCGQGYLSRMMADRGAEVVGVEPVASMVEYARAKERAISRGVEYHERDLSRLGDELGVFDAVVANMVFLDIPDWKPAMKSCVDSLRAGGRFVFSLEHPCWPTDAAETWRAKGCVELREYVAEYEVQRTFGPNFHRPLSTYVNHVIGLGCDIREIAEPGLAPEVAADAGDDAAAAVHIPNFIVILAVRR